MRGRRFLGAFVLFVLAAAPLAAQRRSYAPIGNLNSRYGVHQGRHYQFGYGHGYRSGFRGGTVFGPPVFSYGYSNYGSYGAYGYGGDAYYPGGYAYYPSHYPPYPYPAQLPAQTPNVVVIAEATHDWRHWSPPVNLGEPERGQPRRDTRVIGMGIPTWATADDPPLGDVARQLREKRAQSPPRPQYRFIN